MRKNLCQVSGFPDLDSADEKPICNGMEVIVVVLSFQAGVKVTA